MHNILCTIVVFDDSSILETWYFILDIPAVNTYIDENVIEHIFGAPITQEARNSNSLIGTPLFLYCTYRI